MAAKRGDATKRHRANERLTCYLSFALTIIANVVYIHFTSCWSLIRIERERARTRKTSDVIFFSGQTMVTLTSHGAQYQARYAPWISRWTTAPLWCFTVRFEVDRYLIVRNGVPFAIM